MFLEERARDRLVNGGLSMLGELITVAAYRLNIKIVIKKKTLGQIKWERMVFS